MFVFAVGGKKQFSLLPLSSFKSDSRSNISPPLFIPCLAGTNLPQMSSDTLISVIANILFKIYLWNTTRALSINQCFLKIKCEGPWSNSVTHCKAVFSRSRLALSTKPILGGGFVCFSASEFSAEAITVPTKVVFTFHCTSFRVKLTVVGSGWSVNMQGVFI